jgi:hypothetical protein
MGVNIKVTELQKAGSLWEQLTSACTQDQDQFALEKLQRENWLLQQTNRTAGEPPMQAAVMTQTTIYLRTQKGPKK